MMTCISHPIIKYKFLNKLDNFFFFHLFKYNYYKYMVI
jgi:hypothetical protein